MNVKILALTLSLFAALVLASILTLQVVKNSTDPKSKPSTSPDSYVTNVTYTKMDDKGAVQVVFFTPYVVNYQARNYVEFQKPDIRLTNQQGAPWYITADKGTSDNNAKIINLLDNVKMQQMSQSKSGDLLITTNSAVVYIDKKYATTDQPITIKQGEFNVNAIGANADLNKGVVNLLSHVKEVYVPANNNPKTII